MMNVLPIDRHRQAKTVSAHRDGPPYYSVEFSVKDPKLLYQFRIWNLDADAMYILVKENSAMLGRLKTGEIFETKYYSGDALHPTVDSRTEIKVITREEDGRFKGHYRVGLNMIPEQRQAMAG